MLGLALQKIETSLRRMKTVMSRMHEKCAPEAFFNKLRPFLAGWDSLAFQKKGLEGLIYEGVSTVPKRLVGGTAAQSSTLPSFDAALGVQAPAPEKKLLDTFRDYMPPAHSDFIDAVRNGPSIKSYVSNSNINSLHELYNRCLTALEQFRSYHIQLTARYIVAMANKKNNSEQSSQALAGTGGTGFMDFLKNLRDNTKDMAFKS
ncbi:indoleamine 2,3-dioxygenase 2-like [Amphiura filiformis]|uniref:indoleamine 2,3-dioxygenase 2-like n=1 Tax=Amphiura filiformis TaxID=82378 RepID=UPI003B20E3B0